MKLIFVNDNGDVLNEWRLDDELDQGAFLALIDAGEIDKESEAARTIMMEIDGV
jgi:hypothetical protein